MKLYGLLRTALNALVVVALIGPAIGVVADEGMWTFDNPPTKLLQDKYGFTPTADWLEHVRLSSVRFNDGGSGSFISANGLVLTNHHVARGQLQKLSTPQRDLVKNGFYARTRAEELKCPDLELNVLTSMEDVTARVQKVLKPGVAEEETLKARNAEIAAIEKESLDKTGLRSDVTTLYHGGEYWLYRYKKYTDVRLVFAPEGQAAFFGGDPDNFTYPRHDLDFTIVRAYENAKPAATPHFLKWNSKGGADGELVFVSGHPGSTERLQTMAQLQYNRDHHLPWLLSTYKRRADVLRTYSTRGEEQKRQAGNLIFSLENAIKAYTGELGGLRDAALIAAKEKDERAFRDKISASPDLKKQFGDPWSDIAKVQDAKIKSLTHNVSSLSRLISTAIQIVQYVAEVKKPDAERLAGYHEAQLESLKFGLLSPAPFYPEMDAMLLADAWTQIQERDANDAYLKAALGGRNPEEVAREVTQQTKLADPAFRKSLIDGGDKAVAESSDPLVALARRIDPIIRERTKWHEKEIESVETRAGEQIGKARFAVYGKTVSPDATFTLRLAYGTVAGYPMNGTIAPYKTTFHGLYDRAFSFDRKPPYELSDRFVKRKATIDLGTPLNFVNTCDIIGGNSGSPVINRKGELVGLIFDGNIESLVANYAYDLEKSRAVAVHAAAIVEALRKVYDAAPLADVLEGRMTKTATTGTKSSPGL
jgi:hypothetical protein